MAKPLEQPKNVLDTRTMRGDEVVAELRKTKGLKLAVLGSHQLDAKAVASALIAQRDAIVDLVGKAPVRILTGCADVGAEKAARLAAKGITGNGAVVFHRPEITYGIKPAEQMRDVLLAQEGDALLLLTDGKKCCKHARDRFTARMKKIYEIEIG